MSELGHADLWYKMRNSLVKINTCKTWLKFLKSLGKGNALEKCVLCVILC